MPNLPKPDNGTRLKAFRQAASLSQRDLASLIGETNTNIAYWERSGKVPCSDVLAPMAKALGVSVEEILGEPRPSRAISPGGKVLRTFDEVSKLPHRQQEHIMKVVDALVFQAKAA